MSTASSSITVPQTKGVAAPSQTLAPWSSNWDAPMTSLFRDPFFSRELTPFGGFGGLGGLGGFGGFGGLGLTPFRGAFDELAAMQQRLQASMPAIITVDIIESPNGYELSANVPGYKKDELTVNVDSAANTITVTAQKKDSSRTDTVEGGYRVHRRERSETYAQRVLGLPANIKRDAIKSELKEGVLHVTMPKTAESVANQPTRIPIA